MDIIVSILNCVRKEVAVMGSTLLNRSKFVYLQLHYTSLEKRLKRVTGSKYRRAEPPTPISGCAFDIPFVLPTFSVRYSKISLVQAITCATRTPTVLQMAA